MLVSEEGNQVEEEGNDSIVNSAGLWRHNIVNIVGLWRHKAVAPSSTVQVVAQCTAELLLSQCSKSRVFNTLRIKIARIVRIESRVLEKSVAIMAQGPDQSPASSQGM